MADGRESFHDWLHGWDGLDERGLLHPPVAGHVHVLRRHTGLDARTDRLDALNHRLEQGSLRLARLVAHAARASEVKEVATIGAIAVDVEEVALLQAPRRVG